MNTLSNPSAEAASVLNSIRRLVRALRLFSRQTEGRSGISAAQLFLLQQLQGSEALSLKELAARTMTDTSSACVVAERLERQGLVERGRSSRDRRVREIRLTQQGSQLIKGIPDTLQARLLASVAGMRPAQRRALEKGLRLMLSGAGLEGEKPQLFFEGERP
jgi:DNA-binding MarR family transcriptional regulator